MPTVNELLEESIALWRDSGTSFPRLARKYDAQEQSAREEHLARFLKSTEPDLLKPPLAKLEREQTRERITSAFIQFATSALDLENRHLELLLGREFSGVGTDLGKQARRFDPGVGASEILQACRNAWTACGLQGLFGKAMQVTPAIFAYSMLYPYSDNYLDDPAISRDAKFGFSRRFGRRLAGEAVPAENPREATIWRLVDLIEGQYPRTDYPQVFSSLLAIHRAQDESIRLLRGVTSDEGLDVLKLCFAKGGTSVLADAYLAAGTLTVDEARFAFNWGVLLQLVDDLQDVHHDRERGLLTMFSQAAGREPLDLLTSRALHFAERVMKRLDCLVQPGSETLKELIKRSSQSLLIRSAAGAGKFHTPEYLAELETHAPFRALFFEGRRKQLERRRGLYVRLFEAFLAAEDSEPVFPLLPSTLMARF